MVMLTSCLFIDRSDESTYPDRNDDIEHSRANSIDETRYKIAISEETPFIRLFDLTVLPYRKSSSLRSAPSTVDWRQKRPKEIRAR